MNNNLSKKAVRQSLLQELGEDTTAEEQQIDIMVYKLYELTYDEEKIVEPEFIILKKYYNNYQIN